VDSIPEVPGWNEKLASSSEAIVKAERTDMDIDEMKKTTIEVLQHEFQTTTTSKKPKRIF
jgi:hypothetical protein